MLGQDRDASRGVFFQVWEQYSKGGQLDAMQQMILSVVLEHPEYHRTLEDPDALHRDYGPETGQENPFLHMGMHIAVREQISTDRPPGVSTIYQTLSAKHDDEHKLQHRIMECLGESLWQAQRNGVMPDEAAYLECLKKAI